MTVNIFQTASELLDYTVDWATRGLGTDTISTSTFSGSSGDFTISTTSIGASPSSNAANSATVFWLTGGVPGKFYSINNTIVTVGGRTMQETIIFACLSARTL
jgi:hypothetical protein